MKKHLLSLAVAAGVALSSVASAAETIEWNLFAGSLDVMAEGVEPTVGGVQMHGTATVTVGGKIFLYVVGGNRASGEGDSVRISYAEVTQSPVTVGPWRHTTFAFPTDTSGFAIASAYTERSTFGYNGRLYVLGGDSNSSAEAGHNGIRVFEPTATGDILAEATTLGLSGVGATPTLDRFPGVAAVNPATGFVYITGGNTNDVQRATIDPVTGAVSNLVTLASQTLWPVFFSNGSVVKGDYLYVTTTNDVAHRAKVQFALINPDGTLGSFADTTPLPTPTADGGVAVLNNEIYVLVGHNGGNFVPSDKVYRSVSGPNGTITAWEAEPVVPGTLPDAPGAIPGLRRVGATPVSNWGIAIAGGRSYDSSFLPNVYIATLLNSNVDSWSLY